MAQFKSNYAVLVTLNVTDGTIQEQTCRTINITFSQYAMQCNAMQYNTMQCNAMQYNAIQCNTMQYNAMQCNVCTKSVRPYGMKSVSHFFFFFFIFFKNKNDKILLKTRFRTQDLSLKWKSDTDGRTWMNHLPLAKWKYQCKMSVCTNVTDGQTSFSYFSLVSVQSHTVK
jgi:hypothetical protein